MTTTEEHFERFKHHSRLADQYGEIYEREKCKTKTHAYKAASILRGMLQEHEGELLSRIKGEHPDSDNPVEAWLDDAFAPLTTLGESYTDLFRFIEEGMTVEEYAGVGE